MKKEIIISSLLLSMLNLNNNKKNNRNNKEEKNDRLKKEVLKAFKNTIKIENEIKAKIEKILLENSNISKDLNKDELKIIVEKIRLEQKQEEVKKIKELLDKINFDY